jgi:hypothetical protein
MLDLPTGEEEWSVSRPGYIILRERAPGTHWIGGLVSTPTGLDAVEYGIFPCPYRE